MRKYWTIFKIALENNLAYRGHAFVWMFFDLLWIGVFPFIWLFILNAQGGEINGWNGSMIIMYYVFMAILSNIVLMHPEAFIAAQIYEGRFSNHIIKPQSYLAYVFLHESAYKLVRFLLFVPFLIPLLLTIKHFGGIAETAAQFPFAVLAMIFAIPIFFLTAAIVGMTSFWLEDSYAARTIFWASSGLFGGQYAPFELMPEIFSTIASVLPFKYTLYFPLSIASRHMETAQIINGLAAQLLWIVILLIFAAVVWKYGLRKYSAVGR